MSFDAQLRAAGVLMLCMPPRKSTAAVKSLVKLRGGPSEEEPTFIEHLLGTANQVLKPTSCANTRCQQTFLPSEYNRDGDSYRCPWCNKFSSSGRSFAKRSSEASKALRDLERRLIERFQEYGRLYYDDCTANCYVWSNDGTVDDIGIAVLIAKEAEPTTDASVAAVYGNSVWNSSHVFSIRIDPRDRRTAYRSYSTVYVDVGASSCRFSGFINRKHPTFHGPVVTDLTSHIAMVGNHVQAVENKIRDDIANVHFGKAAQVTSALRSYDVTRRAAVDNPMTRAMPPPPPMPLPTAAPREATSQPRVVAPPPPPPPRAADPAPVVHFREPEPEPVAEEAPEEEEAEEAAGDDAVVEVDEAEVTLQQVLESLELDDVDNLVALLAAASVNTVAELLECDDEYLKRTAGLPKNARKAISEWIAWQYEGAEEAEA